MICPYCQQHHTNEGDRYGCPWCHAQPTEKNMKTDRLTIRMTPEIKAEAKRLAAAQDRSLTNWLERLIMAESRRVAAGEK